MWSAFATVCRECPAGCGMHLLFRDGRVTKAEGNPEHPVNRGGLCPRGQASVQGLYDPDRLRRIITKETMLGSRQLEWPDALGRLGEKLRKAGTRVAVLSDLQTGSLAELMRRFVRAFGSDRLLFYEPFGYGPLKAAHESLFARKAIPEYRLDKGDFVISFAAEFLETWVSPVEFARQFAAMHTLQNGRMGRMVYVGPHVSMTAANADEFIKVAPGSERWVALSMLETMLKEGWVRENASDVQAATRALRSGQAAATAGVGPELIRKLAYAFSHSTGSVALAGPTASESPLARDTAAAAALLNYAAGQTGKSVDFSREHALSTTADAQNVRQFLEALTPDDVLIVHNTNIAYTMPDAVELLRRVKTIVYLSTLPDETAEIADWLLPIDYYLESWGEYEPYTGIHGLLQPTMARLYDTRAAGDVLLDLAKAAGRPIAAAGDFYAALQDRWRSIHARSASGAPFDAFWQTALQAGGFWENVPGVTVSLNKANPVEFTAAVSLPGSRDQADLWLAPSIMFFDGRLANRGWLQEAPHPVSYAAWNSWLDIHPDKAKALSIDNDDFVEVKGPHGSATVPVRITDEVASDTVALLLGQGHSASHLHLAKGIGVNGFLLIDGTQTGNAFARVSLKKTEGEHGVVYGAPTQDQHNRDILQTIPLTAARTMKPGEGKSLILPLPEGYRPGKDVFPPHPYTKHRWAMVIDLQRCIGCGACAIACYAENNIAVMGRHDVKRGLELAWLKVVPYRHEEDPKRLSWLPMLCQHCDRAPCEPVCPVYASVHNDEGLNAQIYNRCIGTRYCSNNCPYKVRRFNWKNIHWKPPLDKQLNPEVTVRCRGVMEKCTFCVQRIRAAEYRALREHRRVRDGEIAPACVQSCPTRAFTFGDLLDPEAAVTRLTRLDPRRYHVLEELNTKPAIAYLKRIVNDEAL